MIDSQAEIWFDDISIHYRFGFLLSFPAPQDLVRILGIGFREPFRAIEFSGGRDADLPSGDFGTRQMQCAERTADFLNLELAAR